MPQDQWERMTCRDAVKCESDIGVAYAAAGNFDDDFVRARIKSWELTSLQQGARSPQLESVSPLNACHRVPRRLRVLLIYCTYVNVETHSKQ